jgi:hypothetical protein
MSGYHIAESLNEVPCSRGSCGRGDCGQTVKATILQPCEDKTVSDTRYLTLHT